ncbi:AMP-binding protein [Desulfovibrio inopinatus]|uniref:AMP-binding protein n=1 Tax=Desulfovibrio inopinatus TaxID=102109 RepID=UPI000429D2FC|nr:AMP-binding protein [Desulfovibrio inopinatus]
MKKQSFGSYEEFLAKFRLEVPENYNFAYDVIDENARQDPTRLAMIHIDDAGTRRDYTFADLATQSSRLANALTEAGIGKGDKVMLILLRRVEFWVSMLALSKIGALAVPSPALLTQKDIEYRVNFAKIKAILCEDSVADRVDAAQKACPSLKVLVSAGETEPHPGWHDFDAFCAGKNDIYVPTGERPGGEDPLLIFFSSGTTGQPKMVEQLHSYSLAHYITGVYWHDLEPGDVHLTLADTGWGKAVWGKYFGQWMAGATVFVWDFRGKFEPSALLDVISRHGVTTFCAPPTVYRFLIREDLSAYDLSKLRHCTTAGELLNDSVFISWKESTGLPIYEGYGQTETTLLLATYPFMTPKPGSIGRPTPGWDIVLLDADGNVCPPGEEGEISVSLKKGYPAGLFNGYLEEPERTALVLDENYYRTGDKAWMDEDGYYWFLGRVDDLIKSSGYRIGPFEVESALITHPAIVEAAVTGVPDPIRGQAVKATVVLAPGFEANDELTKQLQDHVKQVTAPYKYPRFIDYVSELPKTISGKIKRAEIRARDEGNN